MALANVYYVQRYVAATHILRASTRPILAAGAAGALLVLLPRLHLYWAAPLAGVLYVTGLLALRTFSAAELSQFKALLRDGLARWNQERGGLDCAP